MALVLGDNFSYGGSKPLDARLRYETLANMKAVADPTMYDGCMAYCKETDKTYQWKFTNIVDADTGRWREFSSGGMPEIVANKFSKGDLYSTDEKMIGQWVDGKPLYQKTVTYTLSGAISDDDFTIPVSLTDLETVAMAYGTLYSGVNICVPLVTSAQAMKQYSLQVGLIAIGAVTDSSIQIRCPKQSLNSGDKVNVTVRYTKTTDSAISIGDDTDYSTNEKIVGTWVGGEPLYQITVELSNINTLNDWNWTSLDSLIGTNIGIIMKINSFGVRTDNSIIDSEYFYNSSDTCFVLVQKVNNSCSIGIKTSTITYSKYYVTIQYTKTT